MAEHDVDDRYVLRRDFEDFRDENRAQHAVTAAQLQVLIKHMAAMQGGVKMLTIMGGLLTVAASVATIVVMVVK